MASSFALHCLPIAARTAPNRQKARKIRSQGDTRKPSDYARQLLMRQGISAGQAASFPKNSRGARRSLRKFADFSEEPPAFWTQAGQNDPPGEKGF